jgi:hypothetical protein
MKRRLGTLKDLSWVFGPDPTSIVCAATFAGVSSLGSDSFAATFLLAATSAKVRPVFSCTAAAPMKFCQRKTATST